MRTQRGATARRAVWPLAGALLAALYPAAVSAADAGAGQAAFVNCLACHAVGPEPPPRLGPHLNGILGRQAGALEGYAYSDPMRNAGIAWSPETLRQFLRDPQALVPGTRMPFAGLRDPAAIDDLTAYLARFAADGSQTDSP